MAEPADFEVVKFHPFLDELLSEHRAQIGVQWEGYRNHCLTVYNIIRAGMQLTAEQVTAVIIAVAFHDLALWTDDRFDYLDPSVARASDYCEGIGRADLIPLIELMIHNHHKIFRGSLKRHDPLVIAFRDADWSAFTFGLIPFDRFTASRKLIAVAFPSAGFHYFLARLSLHHIATGGLLNPFPMMKL